MRQADPDLWGYLSYGKLFVERGGVTDRDPFAYTSDAFRWVTFEYGAQVTLWLAYKGAGAIGLIALKCLLGGVALHFLYVAIRLDCDEPSIWVPTFLLCTSALSRFFQFRPQLFTFAFFAVFVAVLFRFLHRRGAPLWMLPPLMLVWANTHGGFVAGLGALGLAILLRASENLATYGWHIRRLGDGTKALWLTLAACAAATFVNPLGPRLWVYVLTELAHGTNRQYIKEWAPATFATDAWSTIVLTLSATILVFVGWAASRRLERTDGPAPACWVASCMPLIAMSYLSVRHVPLAAIWVGPVIAMLGSQAHEQLSKLVTFRRVWFVLRGLALLPACLTFGVVYAQPQPSIRTGGAVLGATHPCGAVGFLRRHALEGTVYNPLWWGSYLTWELYPQVRVSMDGRNISLFSDEMVVENLRFYSDDASAVDIDAPLRYATDFLIVPVDSPVIIRLVTDERWREIYRDDDAVLFARADGRDRAGAKETRPDGAAVSGSCPGVFK